MKTIRIKVYSFDELSNEGKQKAIDDYRNKGYNDDSFYAEEIISSVKKLAEVFNLEIGRTYSDIRKGHIDDNILQLTGVRLYKYIVNNYYNDLFTPTYKKCIDRTVKWKQFICKNNKGKNGEYTMIFSKHKVDNSCTLTGVCYDNDILQPVYDFLKKIDTSMTFEELINEIESAISKCFESNEEWVNSDEFISEEIENNDYQFTKDGNQFN